MSRFTFQRGEELHYNLWLVIDKDGEVRMTRGQPATGRGEVACSVLLKAPVSLFRKPLLKVEVQVPATAGLTDGEAIKTITDLLVQSDLNIDIAIQDPN